MDMTAGTSVESGSKVRFVTAASLFDGHDAAINIMRRILQSCGVEVIHLGHNRSVAEIVYTALEEDVNGIALSSYQGGHVEYLKYMVDMLKQQGAEHIKIFAGGGGVIVPEEIELLQDYGVTRIYSPEDGLEMGLKGMIENSIKLSRFKRGSCSDEILADVKSGNRRALARLLTAIENDEVPNKQMIIINEQAAGLKKRIPVLGITGTGGAGKSSLTDEIILRFRMGSGDKLNTSRHLPSIRPGVKQAAPCWVTASE